MSIPIPAHIQSEDEAIGLPPLPHSRSPTTDEVDQKPWKYMGYPKYIGLLTSDASFLNFRRFEELNTRVILAMQDELTQTEEELKQLDNHYMDRDTEDTHNGSFRHCQDRRKQLIWRAGELLERYNRYIGQYIPILTRGSAEERNVESLKTWHANHEDAINEAERGYVKKKDLFALVPKDKSPLRRLFERSKYFRFASVFEEKQAYATRNSSRDVHYASDKRMGFVMLTIPMWALAFTGTIVNKLAGSTILLLFFLVMVSSGTIAKPHESIIAAAGYCAVLVMFLQIKTCS